MTDIMELRAKRANLWEAAKAFLDTHTGKDGKLSQEDSDAYDRMEADVVALGKDIERLERQAAIDKELAQPTNKPITNAPGGKAERPQSAYHDAVMDAIRSRFRKVSDVLQEGVDTDGGYLVPEEMDSRLVDVLTEENVMRTLGTSLTTSGERKINIAATKPAASWIEEGGALSFGEATFDQIILDAHKLHVAIKVTEELLYDNAFNLESYIIEQFGKAIANRLPLPLKTGKIEAEIVGGADMANRQYKDSVFRKLFHNKRELANLYQAIRPEDTIFAKDIKLTTLRNVFTDSQRNDLSFLWKQRVVVLMEHQSTWNENIPLRMLPYADHVYSKIIKIMEAQKAMYQEALVKIPTPKFYMLYNGRPQKKFRDVLKLSDAFAEKDGDLELRVHVIDISYSETNEILQSCEPLYGYSYLVHLIQSYKKN